MNYQENILKKKRLIIWLVLVILLFLTLFLKLHPLDLTPGSFWNDIIKEVNSQLLSTLLPLISFGLFYQVYTENENKQIAKKDIIDSIHLSPESLSLFSKESKMDFLKAIISSLIGEKYGSLLYQNLIKKYINDDLLYREKFVYNVEICESKKDFHFKGISVLPSSEYHSLNQTLSYEKHFKKEKKDIGFKIVFAFNAKSLDHWMNDDAVFFREILQIDGWEDSINTYSAQDFKEFVEKGLCLTVGFFDSHGNKIPIEDTFSIDYINKDYARGIEISLKDKKFLKTILSINKSSVSYFCKLSFKMPYSKKMSRFNFVLVDPTLNPKFSMKFDNSFNNVDYFSYLSNSSKRLTIEVDEVLSQYSIAASDIVYPRSGVIFFWQ